MAAPSWVKKQLSGNFGLSGSYTVTLPSSITAGNLLVMSVLSYATDGASVNTPSGWTSAAASTGMGFNDWCKAYVFYKLAGGSESAPTLTGTFNNISIWISEVSGVNSTTPVSASASGTPNTSGTVPTPASTAAVAESLAVFFAYENNGSASYTGLPSGSSSRYNEVGAPNSFSGVWADMTAGAGAISAASFTRTATTYKGVAHTLVIAPASAPTFVPQIAIL